MAQHPCENERFEKRQQFLRSGVNLLDFDELDDYFAGDGPFLKSERSAFTWFYLQKRYLTQGFISWKEDLSDVEHEFGIPMYDRHYNLIDTCIEEWDKMTPEQRAVYQNMADEDKKRVAREESFFSGK